MNSNDFFNHQVAELDRFTKTITAEINEFVEAERIHKVELQQREDAAEKSQRLKNEAYNQYKTDIQDINHNPNLSWWERENAISIAMKRRENLLCSASLESMKTLSTGRYELTVLKLQLRTWLRSWFL